MHDAVVVGGGIAGLTAAWALRDKDVRLFEANDRLGGRIRSEPRDDLWLNLGAHVFSGAGSATARLLAEVGVQDAPVSGELVALELNGRRIVGGRPELYPFRLPLSLGERIALARAGARLKLAVRRYTKAAAARPGEPPARRGGGCCSLATTRASPIGWGRYPAMQQRSFGPRCRGRPPNLTRSRPARASATSLWCGARAAGFPATSSADPEY